MARHYTSAADAVRDLVDHADIHRPALSRGLLTGSEPGVGDFRAHLPRFTGDNLAKNQALAATLAQLAARRGVTPAQLAIAWARAKGPAIIPLVGARTRKQLDDALAAFVTRALCR